MKLLKVAAIAAIVFSGSALAGVVPQYGGGGNHGGGGNNSVSVYQRGQQRCAGDPCRPAAYHLR